MNYAYDKAPNRFRQAGITMATRAVRANGEVSRRRILDAASEIAGERGYSGTSISEVSKLSGLPNSSIYWHFKDKDALFAAVIEDSYSRWLDDFRARSREPMASPGEAVARLHESLLGFPAFLRFGHLVILEQHDEELSARVAFIRIRKRALTDLRDAFVALTGCDRAQGKTLAALSLALVDGAFLAGAAGETTLSNSDALGVMFDAYVDSLSSTERRR
jgi:AcrR family transcriptional regulator